jgi:hypothetical protein
MSSSGSPMPIDDTPPAARRVGPALVAGWLAALGLAALVGTAPAPALADDAAFDRTLRKLGAFCARGSALTCAEQFFALADADGDGRVVPGEIQAFKDRLRIWTAANGESLHATDLRALQAGFLLVDTIGIERGMLLYDADGDGALSFAEATADLNLDGRPMAQLVQDRELVNWPSLRRRFGAMAMLFDYLDIR